MTDAKKTLVSIAVIVGVILVIVLMHQYAAPKIYETVHGGDIENVDELKRKLQREYQVLSDNVQRVSMDEAEKINKRMACIERTMRKLKGQLR